MEIFGKRWFRLLLEFLIVSAMFIAVIVISGTDSTGLSVYFRSFEFIRNGFFFGGVFGLAGVLLFCICFDLMGEIENPILGILRVILLILGSLIALVMGSLSFIIVYSKGRAAVSSANPWAAGLGSFWLLGYAATFLLYFLADDNYWSEVILPFIPPISHIGAYLITVIFTYIGNAAGAFFYWIPLIIVVLGIAVIIYLIKKNGLPFDGGKSYKGGAASYSGNFSAGENKSSAPPERHSSTERKSGGDSRKDFNGERPVLRALSPIVNNTYGLLWNPNREKLDLRVKVIKLSEHSTTSVYYSGTFVYEDSNPTAMTSSNMNYDYNKVLEKLRRETESAVKAVGREYKGYDSKCQISFSITKQLKS